ncbi:tandem-95 repeat protein [Piscinibacter sp.]|uniref:tandem-95 repeat protein n=1 Tax=Piscinibacter sp. TaxID=1903157 RepID=UPI0037841C83
MIRGADGKLRLLKVGDIVRKGDQILTTQDGIVQIANGDGTVQAAQAKKPAAAPAGDEVERAIGELDRGDRDAAPAAGLAGGGDGSLQEGYRVERIGEALGTAEVPRSSGDAALRVDVNNTGTASSDGRTGVPALSAPSSAISAVEEGAPANLGLVAPTGPAASGTIRVDHVPAVGEIHKADGTLVTAGTVLTPADLPGLTYVPPAEYDGTVPAGNFSYTLTTADGRSNIGGTSITLSPLNDAPVATPGSASGNEDGSLPISLSGTDVDGRIVGVTVTALPAGGTLWLADGVTPVAVGQTITPEQAASLLYRPSADFHGDQTILFTVTDNGGATSAPAAVSLTVVSVNDLPQAAGSGGSGNEDTPIAVHLGGVDVDGSVVAVTVTSLPANGTLYLADGITPVAAGSALTPAQAASLVFVPNHDFSGNVTIVFTLTDDQGGTSAPASAVVTVLPVNDAPVALPDGATLAEDSFATGNVLGNDGDVDGPALAVASFSFGGNSFAAGSTAIVGGVGTLSVAANGNWTFTPAPNFNGAVPPIVITISDGSLTSTSALTLSVTPINDAPLAQADLASTPINTPATIAVLANDSDAEGEALTVTAATLADPAQGTVIINPDGTLGFVPAANFTGTVTINYTVSDASGASSVSTVTVSVGTNNAPSGADVTRSLGEDGSYTLQPADLGFSDADAGQTLAGVRIDSLPAAGTLLLNGAPVVAGTVVTAAQLASGALQFHPAADGNGSNYAHFTFSVQDSAGAFDTTPNTFRFDVTPANDAPVASSSAITVAEESVNTPLGLVAPTDIDGDALTITVTGLPSVGTVTLADGTPVTNGQVLTAAQLAGLQFDAPADLAAATNTSFSYSVNDGSVTVNAGTTISVTPVNDAPVASSSTITVAEESANTPLGLTAPTDADGNALTITVTGLPAVGTVTLADGTPVTNGQVLTAAQLAGLQFDAPADQLAATTTSFTYSVSDGTVTVNAGTTINVTPVNDAPVASSSAITVAEESVNTPLGLTAPTDVDGDALTITVTGLPTVGTITLADGTPVTTGQVLTAAQLAGLQFDAPADLPSATTTSFSYSVSDGTTTVNAGTTIGVTPINDAPVASNSTITAAEESVDTPLGLTAPTDVDGDALTITVTGLPTVGTITLADGTPVTNGQVLTAAQLAGLQFDAPADQLTATTTSFTYSVSDGTTTVNAGTTINVTPVNDAPVASSSTITVAEESVNTPLGLAAPSDVDGNALTITVTGLPAVGTVTLADGTPVTNGQVLTAAQLAGLQFDAPADQLAATTTSFTYSVSDGTTTVNAGTTINVTPINDAPVASSSAITVAEESVNTPLGLVAPTDVDGNALTITVTGLSAVGTVTLADGTPVTNGQVLTAAQLAGLQFDAPADQLAATTTSFSYSVSDGTVTVNAGTTINVTPVNDAPVASSSTITVAEESTNTPLGLAAPTDVDGNALTITVTGLPAVGTITLADGTPVTNGQVLTAAQLAGLQFDAPADQLAATTTTFSYSVSDGTTTVNAGTTINVTPINDAPVASSSTITVAEESANTPLGLAAPTDVDGNALTITVTGLPAVGTITLADGTPVTNGQVLTAAQLAGLQFDAPADQLAATTTTFTYSVSDGTTSVNAGTTINVTPVNDAPVASSSTITVAEESVDTPLGLRAPTDIDGNALTITVTGLPTVGTVTLADGTPVTNGQVLTAAQLAGLQFDAPADQLAATTTTFTYSVSDGSATVNAGTTINVTPVNDAPVATADLASTSINIALPAINVLANDSDVDGDALTVTSATLAVPAQGTVSVNADGSLNFVPANNFSGAVLINYTIADGHGGTATASVTVNVGTNTPPQGADATVSMVEDGSRVFAPSDFGFTDADAGQSLAAVRIDALPGAGTLLLNGSPIAANTVVTLAQLNAGALSFAPAPNANGTGYASFGFSVQDNAGAFDANPNTITINVTPVNDAPVASSSTITVAEESVNTPLGLAAPSDVDGDALTITVTGLPAVGTVTLADGTPVTNGQVLTAAQLAGLQFDAPADLAAATATSFTYSVNDGTTTVNAGTTINVTPVNDAPVASSSTITVAEESVNTPLGLTAPTDVDGNALTITVTGLPAVGTVTLADGTPVTNGQVLTAAQLTGLQFDAPADLAAATTASFSYSVSDGTVTVNAGTTINVTPVNDVPVAQASAFTVAEDAAVVNGVVTATDADVGATFTFALNGAAPAGLTFNADGSYSFNPANAAYQSLGVGQQTIITVPYTVTDNAGATSTANLVITVTGTNDAPVANADTAAASEDNALTITPATLLGNDTDIDNGTTLSITSVQGAVNGSVALVGGNVVFTPAANYNGPASFTYTVSDGNGGTSTATVTVNVAVVNDAPVAQAAAFTVAEDAAVVNGAVTATDVDAGSTLSFALNGAAPAGLTFNSNGSYSFNPANAAYQSLGVGQQTVITVPYTVTDNTGATSTANLVITVTGTNDAPVANANTVAATEDTALTITPATLLGNDTDIDSGTTLSITSVQGAVNGTVALVGGNVVFTPAANYNGPASFTYTVSDGNGGTSTATVTVNVAAVNDAPLNSVPGTQAINEDTTRVFSSANGNAITVADIDSGSLTTTLSAANGTLTLGSTAGVTVTGNGSGTVTITGSAAAINTALNGTTFAPTANYSGSTTVTVSTSDGSASDTDSIAINITPVADAPSLTIDVRGSTVSFTSSGETAANSDNTSEVVTTVPFEGWTRVNTPDNNPGGTNAVEVWTTGDTQQRQNGGYNTVVASIGNGDNFIELNDASSNVQTIGLTRTVSTQAGMVYELSLDYAGRPGFTADYTRIGVYVDGVLVQQYASTSPQTYLDWQNLKFAFVGDGANHVITIQTDATQFNAAGRGAMIDDIRLTGTPGVVAGNAASGTLTSVALDTFVSGPLVDGDGSETLTLTFSGLPSGAVIVTAANPGGYTASGGAITISGAELASAQLQFSSSVTGHLSVGVTATATEGANGSTASATNTLELDVLPKFESSDLGGDGLTNRIGTTGDETLNGNNGADYLIGRAGTDTLNGSGGNDYLDGGSGTDTLNGGAGADVLYGGAGNDILRGGTATTADGASDVFAWTLSDRGTAGSGPVDTITDFSNAAASAGGDVLDLRDLLVGENTGNLSSFLHFSYDSASNTTTIQISSTGSFAAGNYAGATDQTIVLTGVNLLSGGLTTDQQVISDLLTKAKLLVDN